MVVFLVLPSCITLLTGSYNASMCVTASLTSVVVSDGARGGDRFIGFLLFISIFSWYQYIFFALALGLNPTCQAASDTLHVHGFIYPHLAHKRSVTQNLTCHRKSGQACVSIYYRLLMRSNTCTNTCAAQQGIYATIFVRNTRIGRNRKSGSPVLLTDR